MMMTIGDLTVDLNNTETLNEFLSLFFKRDRKKAGSQGAPGQQEARDAMAEVGIEPVSNVLFKRFEKRNEDLLVPHYRRLAIAAWLLLWLILIASVFVGVINVAGPENETVLLGYRGTIGLLLFAIAVGIIARWIMRTFNKGLVIKEIGMKDIDAVFGLTDDIKRKLIKLRARLPKMPIRVRRAQYDLTDHTSMFPVGLAIEACVVPKPGAEAVWIPLHVIDKVTQEIKVIPEW